MGRLLSIALVFIIGFLGAMTISFFEIGVTTPVNNSSERVACKITDELTENRVTKIDGVRFETVIPQRIITIPPNKPDASTDIKFGLRITNGSSKPYKFSQYVTLSLHLIRFDNTNLPWVIQRRGPKIPTTDDFVFLQPGENTTFWLKGNLFWQKDKLVLMGPESGGGVWMISGDVIGSGIYYIRLIYSTSLTVAITTKILGNEVLEALWLGKATTPFIDICLVNASN